MKKTNKKKSEVQLADLRKILDYEEEIRAAGDALDVHHSEIVYHARRELYSSGSISHSVRVMLAEAKSMASDRTSLRNKALTQYKQIESLSNQRTGVLFLSVISFLSFLFYLPLRGAS